MGALQGTILSGTVIPWAKLHYAAQELYAQHNVPLTFCYEGLFVWAMLKKGEFVADITDDRRNIPANISFKKVDLPRPLQELPRTGFSGASTSRT